MEDNATTNPIIKQSNGSERDENTRSSPTDGKDKMSFIELSAVWIVKRLNFDKGYSFDKKEISYAQRSILSSLKASAGLMIVPYYILFMSSVFWAILTLFIIEAFRTDKSYHLLRTEGLSFLILAIIFTVIGLVTSLLVHYLTRLYFTNEDQELMFGTKFISREEFSSKDLENEGGKNETRIAESKNAVVAEDLGISVELCDDIVHRYLAFIDIPEKLQSDEIKEVLMRSAVYHKKPAQYLIIIGCQVALCVIVGIFTYGHGSVGGILVSAVFTIYKFIGNAGKTIQYTKNLFEMLNDCPRPFLRCFPFLQETSIATFDVDEIFSINGIFGLGVAFQSFVIGQAFAASGETAVFNLEHLLNILVSLLVLLVSICLSLLAPDALTATGTLVAFEFIATLDDQYVNSASVYLVLADFEAIHTRKIFHEDIFGVIIELIFILTAGPIVTNTVVGLSSV